MRQRKFKKEMERNMRAWILAAVFLVGSLGVSPAVVRVPLPNECSDRNALLDVAFDARLTAIQFYYKGLIHGLANKEKKACLLGRVIMDDWFAVLNKAYALMEKDCLPIDVAARLAAQEVCP